MSRLSPATLLSVALLLAATVGCASRNRPTPSDSKPPAEDGKNSATVTSEDVDRMPGVPVEETFNGKVAGAVVTRTADGGVAVRIRGTSTIHGQTAPLYVIDGIPIEPGPGGSLTGINPHDIASIQVLKDAADTAMYGIRGANGVIVIKTKRAGQ
jgi:TonB-dependent SusC/RagA subfamily outer membrane receptor